MPRRSLTRLPTVMKLSLCSHYLLVAEYFDETIILFFLHQNLFFLGGNDSSEIKDHPVTD